MQAFGRSMLVWQLDTFKGFESMIKGLRDPEEPSHAAQLQKFLCGEKWIGPFLPDYARDVVSLQELVSSAQKEVSCLKPSKIKAVPLKSNLTEEHSERFQRWKPILANAVAMAHLRDDQKFCLFTDASDSHWDSF